MPSFITGSILYKILEHFFIKPYEKSLLKKNIDKFVLCFKESFLYKRFERYINKNPYFLNSFCYKIFRKFIKWIDKLMDIIHNFFKRLITGSEIYNEANNIKNAKINRKFLILSILIGALNLGYIIGGLIFITIKPIISFGLLILCFILYIFSLNANCYRESFIYKFIKYLF